MNSMTFASIRSAMSKGKQMMLSPTSGRLLSSFAALVFAAGLPALASAQTLERIQSAGKIVLGFEANASPFSYADDAGQPNGFAIALCGKVVDEVKAQLGLSDLGVEWKPVQFDTRLDAVRDGAIDLLCGADSITLTRRAEVSFSLPVFPSGTGAMMRSDAPAALREILSQDQLTARPIWRGAPARTFLQQKTFAVLPGTVSEGWVKERMLTLQLSSKLLPVNSVDEGIQNVLDGQADVFFGPLPVLLDAALRNAQVGSLAVLNRQFTFEPLGFALARNDEDFRLLVDRALSKTYRSDGFRDLFMRWFGPPDGDLVLFYKQTVLPD